MEHSENAHSPRAKARKKKDARHKILVVVSMVLAVVLLVTVCGYIYIDNLVTEGDSGKLTDDIVTTIPELSKKTVNILVAGIDYDVDDEGRDYSDGLGMTDVIMLACCDLENKTLTMLQIPRDSYVGEEIPTGGTGKINAVFSHGDNTTDRISNLAKVINDQFRLPVDYYVTIDINMFKELISLLGYIEMYVPWDVEDAENNISIPQGTYKLDADHAEWVIRQRHYSQQGDLKRLELQQYFYAAIFKTFMTFPMSDIVKVAPALVNYVNTDLPLSEMLSLFSWMQKLDSNKIGIARCPGGSVSNTGGHKSLYGINAEALAPLLNDYFRPYADPVPASALGLPTGLVYPVGEIPASVSFMGELSAEGSAG